MSIKRTAGQVFIGCWCKEELVDRIDAVRAGSRSQFCRDSIIEKLHGMGERILKSDGQPPDRVKKKSSQYPPSTLRADQMNEAVQSAPPPKPGKGTK